MDFIETIEWQSVKKDGYPPEDEIMLIRCTGIYTGTYEKENDKEQGKWSVDKKMLENTIEWSLISEEEYERIKREQWKTNH